MLRSATSQRITWWKVRKPAQVIRSGDWRHGVVAHWTGKNKRGAPVSFRRWSTFFRHEPLERAIALGPDVVARLSRELRAPSARPLSLLPAPDPKPLGCRRSGAGHA